MTGLARYNLHLDEVDYTLFGISYADECFGLTLSYKSDYTESGNRDRVDTVLLTFSLRTLGGAGFSTDVGGGSNSN